MTNMWVCLAREREHDAMRRALKGCSDAVRVVFVESASELRVWARDAAPGVQVAIGTVDDGPSTLNVAAAVVHDGKASRVVVASHHPTDEFKRRALMLGAQDVLDLSEYDGGVADGLDEPMFASDDVPTLVMDISSSAHREVLSSLPELDSIDSRSRHDYSQREAHTAAVSVITDDAGISDKENGNQGGGAAHSPRRTLSRNAPVIAFFSGRGGVGKTSVVAAMAVAAASWGMRVGLCDLDLSCGNLYSCFGTSGPADLGSIALEKPPTHEELLSCGRPVADRIGLWGSCERPEMADAVYPHVRALIDAVAQRSDVVLVDTATTFTDAAAQAAQQCDRFVLVVDGRPGSSVAQARLGGLAVRLGVARTRIARLANRCGRRGRGEPLINRAEVGLETARPLRVVDGGSEVVDCLAEGKVQDLFDLGSRFAESSAESLAKMLSELGRLPEAPQAQRLLEHRSQRSLWSFGRGREAV